MEAATFSFVSLLTFCFLGRSPAAQPHPPTPSMAAALGYYGAVELAVVGPGCSRLLQASSVLVKGITVTVSEGNGGLVLYGLHGAPPLDVPAEWSEARRVVVPANSHREWVYFLNKGAQIEATHSVNSPYPLFLIIAQGKENFTQWSVNDTTSSWHLMQGNGTIQQTVNLSSAYYIAVRNLNDHQDATVHLNFRIRTLLYNITGADYRCSLGHTCTYRLPFLGRSVVVLSSSLKERLNSDEQHVTLSYDPRWIVYVVGSAILAVALLLVYEILSMLFAPCAGAAAGGADRRRTPLPTASKEDDGESLGSSYDSVSHDGDDEEEARGGGGGGGGGGGVCAVCCDGRRDCFFLPCGHSATCYSCGARSRRKMVAARSAEGR
ncbi:hypothetical protein ACP4OV_020172 [Aristida adscensionis]